MKGLSGAINKHKKAIGVAMIGMGVAAIGAAAASIKAFADMGDEVQKMALRTDFSTEALSELRHAAEISGADLGTLEKGVKKMSKTIVDADEGMATYIRSFDRIGLSAQELMELSPEEQFNKITMAIADLESPTLKAATAQDIFGRAGTALLPLLAEGADGIAELRQEAHKLGIVFDQEAANKAAEFNDSLTRLNGALNGVKFTLAKELMPAMEAGIPLLEKWVVALGPWIETALNWNAVQDKQVKMHRAWQTMAQERYRALQGLSNEYEQAVDLLEATLKNQGLLNAQAIETIKGLREEIEARKDHQEELEGTNELLEEQVEAYEAVTKQIEDAIKEMEYERSAAGRLSISIDDVITALHLMGKSNEYISDTLVGLGDEGDNVIKVLEAFGISAEEINFILGRQKIAVDGLADSYKRYGEEVDKVKEKAGLPSLAAQEKEWEKEFQSWYNDYKAAGGTLTYKRWLEYGRPTEPWQEEIFKKYRTGELTAPEIPGGMPSFQHGGIAMRPITAKIAEDRPEAVIPLDRMGGIMGDRRVNIYVELDGRTIAKAVGQPLVDEIRLKTGVHI